MERTYTRINWENEPSILTPLNASNLNKIDSAVYTIDGRVVGFDTTKANQSDLLQCVKQIDYNTTTGVFTFTWQNGTTQVIDLNIEKIPVSFSMDEHGVITMTTSDGTQYTADVGALIKTYTFNDSDVIDFTVTTDASGNKTVTANIVDGSITGDKLQPNYLADCIEAKNDAESASNSADGYKDAAEAWANGKIDGVPVPSTHPAYHNNAEYYKDMANPTQLSSLTDVDLNNPTNRQALVYDTASGKWVNGSGGLLPQMEITTEDGSTVTISKDGETITATSIGSGKYYAEIPEFGEWTVSASKGSQSATRVVNVDTVKIYDVNASYFTAYINVTAPNGSSVTVVNGSETYTKATAPYNFEVHSAGTWVVTATKTDASKSKNVVISSDGQTVTTSIAFASITVTYPDEMEFETITATDGTRTYTRVASGTVVFDIANYGEWVVSCMNVSVTVNVTADIDYPIELKSGFDVQEWLQAGSVSGTYASLAEVLADEKALRQLFTKHASVDYLVECCSSDLDESVETIINTDLCAKWINLRDYALDKLYENQYIKVAMDTFDKYFYGELVEVDGEYVPKGNVPIMTSNSAPYGEVSSNSVYSGMDAYKAFDGNTSDYWGANTESATPNAYLAYKFVNPICVKGFKYMPRQDSLASSSPEDYVIEGSNDGTNYSPIFTKNGESVPSAGQYVSHSVENENYYLYLRINISRKSGGQGGRLGLAILQFYGRELKVSVPKMSGDNSPFGATIASSTYASSGLEYNPFKAFDNSNSTRWISNNAENSSIGYEFVNEVVIRKAIIYVNASSVSGYHNTTAKIQAFDGSAWEDLTTNFDMPTTSNNTVSVDIENSKQYSKCRLSINGYNEEPSGAKRCTVSELQFYGLDYSEHEERRWIYDHGVEVETLTEQFTGTPTLTKTDCLRFEKGSSGVVGGFYTPQIDFSNYNLIRFVVGANCYQSGNAGFGLIFVANSVGSGYGSNPNIAILPTLPIPYNASLDISNFNDNKYLCFGTDTTSNYTSKTDVAEWWLE